MPECSDRCVRSYLLVLLVYTCCSTYQSSADANSDHHNGLIVITLPPSSMATEDACLGYKVPDDEYYIVKFEAVRDLLQADQIMLYVCEQAKENYRKDCQSVCDDGDSRLIYIWAPFTQTFQTLPNDAGFAIGRGTIAKYLVIQVHYSSPVAGDKSGVNLRLTDIRPVYVVGIYLLVANHGLIKAGSKEVNVDAACKLTSDDVLHFFAYRVHTHSLGRRVTGYKVNDTWHLMGHTDPQSAQLFHMMSTEFEAKKDDFLVARCSYDASSRTRDTVIGYTSSDEMCNLYLMFYTNSTSAAGSKSSASGSKAFYDCSGNNFTQLTRNVPPLPLDGNSSPTEPRDVAKFMVHDQQELFGTRRSERPSLSSATSSEQVEEDLEKERGADDITDDITADSRTVLRKDTADNSTSRSMRKTPPGQRHGDPVVRDYSAVRQRSRNRHPVEETNASQVLDDGSVNKQHSPQQTIVDNDSNNKDLLHSDLNAAAAASNATADVAQSRASSSETETLQMLLTTPTISTLSSTSAWNTSVVSDVTQATPTVPTSTVDLKLTGIHQSVKKGGVLAHYLSDANTDQTAGDNIDKKVTQPSIVGASLIVGILITVPLSVAIVITVCTRLRKNGKPSNCGEDRRHNRRGLNLGDLLSRGRHNGNIGFHYLSSMDEEYHDELDPLRSEESEVEEFSTAAAATVGSSTQRNA